MKKIIPILLIAISLTSFGQDIYFQESFETDSSRSRWTQEILHGDTDWDFVDGGVFPPMAPTALPPSAVSGTKNARFYKSSGVQNETFLISPEFSLEFAQKPQLRFFYAQYEDQLPEGDPDNGKFKVCYRSSEEDNQWVVLREYNDPTEDWVFDSLPLPDSIHYNSLQLGFWGINATVSYGTVIDSITIIETDSISKYIEKIYASQPFLDVVPTGSNNNPIMRLRMPVQGNDGELILDSLAVKAKYETESVVPINGVKLYYTITDKFINPQPLGSPSSFVGGVAVFDNINKSLPSGNSYVWITCDVPEDVNHELKGSRLDLEILPSSIKVNNTYFPSSLSLDPNDYREINESIFFDDFETDKLWNFTGEFERALPAGLGGGYQNPDPNFAHSGSYVIGTDLTGINTPGDYETNLPTNAYTATTQTFDATYYKGLNLQYYRWLNVNFNDTAAVEYSLDGGVTWNRLWASESLFAENSWKFIEQSLSATLDRQPSVTLRFSLGPTGISNTLSGWNIDDFALTGKFVNIDVGLNAWNNLNDGCGLTDSETLSVKIKNFGFDDTDGITPVGFSSNNGNSWVMDTLLQVLAKDEETDFTFTPTIDLSKPGYNNISVKTFKSGDEDSRNNQLDTTIFVFPKYTIPYFEDFEANYGYWKKGGANDTWQHGTPSGIEINTAYSGDNAWVTNLSGDYPNNDSAWLESPCFDFSGRNHPIFECQLYTKGETGNDGLALYYSLDEGNTWTLIPMDVGTYDWDWYNAPSISSLGHAGWDSTSNNWFKVREVLPAPIADNASVKFKFVFASNATVSNEGFAIDDIHIYNAPADAGVFAIVDPISACELDTNQTVTVSIKNYGIRDIRATDTLFTTLIIDGSTTIKDTFKVSAPLAIGATKDFTFSETHNMFPKKWYTLKAYTEVKGDTAFYFEGVYNDTIVDSVYVEGEPFYTLGPDIGTLDATSITLDGGEEADGTGDFLNYNWHNITTGAMPTTKLYNLPAHPMGEDFMIIAIEVENDSLCTATDTIKIIQSDTDLGITKFSGVDSTCIDNQTPTLTVTIKNFRTVDTFTNDTTITIGYSINNGPLYTESFTPGADILPEDSVDYTFTTSPTFSEHGLNTLSVFTSFNADLDYSNDTVTQVFDIYPLPDPEIGPDTVYTTTASAMVLDAGAGYATYLWQEVPGGQTYSIPVNTNAEYRVEVVDVNACGTGYDTLQIIADNWILDSIINPTDLCAPSASEQVSIRIKNASPNNYAAGKNIDARLIFSNDTVTRNISMPEMLSGANYEYTFDTVFDMSALTAYDIAVRIEPGLDISTADNQLNETVNVWGVKYVELGPDTIVTKRADTVLLDAGNNFESYSWQDLSTNSTLQINSKSSFTYWVSVTDYNNCPSSSDTVHIYAYDLGIDEILSPESSCDVDGLKTVKIVLRNNGPDVIPSGEALKIYYQVDDGAIVEKDYIVPSDIEPNETPTVTFSESFSFTTGNTYDFKVYLSWEKDKFHSNDTSFTQVYQLDIPSVDLGADISSSQPDTITLNAPIGYTNYTWQDGSREDFFDVSENKTQDYWVRVGNAYGCFNADTLTITTFNMEIVSITGDENTCATSLNTPITMILGVASEDTIYMGEEIFASYQIDANPVVNETITLGDSIYPGKTYSYEFGQAIDLTTVGNYAFTADFTYAAEVEANNTYTSDIRVGAYPVNLGDDISTYDASVTLDAGAGFTSYLWSNGETTQAINVTISDEYSVIANDVNACMAKDTINVTLLDPSYDIVDVIGFDDACEHDAASTISFLLKNTGNDYIAIDSVIPISYTINGGSAINETYTFTSQLNPNDELSISFNTKANFEDADEYTLHVEAEFGPMTSTKDTIFNTWGVPQPDLGPDVMSTGIMETLDAGPGFATYEWSLGNTDVQTIEVTASGVYWVEVGNDAGCTKRDSIFVSFVPELTITSLINPGDACVYGEEDVQINVQNTGTRDLVSGTSLTFSYLVKNQNTVNQAITTTGTLGTGSSFAFTFADKAVIEDVDNNAITISISLGGSVISTKDFPITLLPAPEFSFGQDTVFTPTYPYTLDPDITDVTYLWSTGETTQSIQVSSDDLYILTTTGDNTCTYTDSVYVKQGTSIENEWAKEIALYPNPVKDMLYINLPKSHKNVILEITDLQGRSVYRKNKVNGKVNVEVSNWNTGVYLVRIYNQKQHALFQIVIE